MLLELAEYLVCFQVDPLSFCLYSSCVSFQLVGNWDQLDDEGRRGTPVGCTCSSHGLQILVFLHLNSTALHCTAEVCVVLDNVFFGHSLTICRRQRAF